MHKRLGLIFLIILLIIITFGIIKPEFYLVGWDNFSSYLNSATNIFNTLFATWREHRGLGVPSDAEVNDIFRQVFDLFTSVIFGKKLADQVYMVFMLWGGVLSMYALGRKISAKFNYSENLKELFGSIAAFFYLFNLSTLAVFYFPMIMYPTRFFMLPSTVFVLLEFIDRANISKKRYLFYIVLLLFGFGSFMVPTIYVVTMIMLFFMALIFKKTKRLFVVLGLYVGLGMFWLLPFANYTIQKANIVPNAPTFIEITEAELNKPKSYFSFEQQAKMRPGFFQSEFTNNATHLVQPFHELARLDKKGWTRLALWIFPTIYLLGIAYVFLFKRSRILIWFSTTTLVFLFLSMKEYSPFGLVYGFISDHVPFANTVFRFGDTKFHAMIAFGGSIITAYFIIELIKKLAIISYSRIIISLTLISIVVLHLFVFKSYFSGNFIGYFMYNKIPTAYFDIANIINKDPESIRVVHLPIDSHSYWKPYTWGYFGSPFLHFMLNKPLFDRAFEPASMENSSVHKELMDTFNLAATVSNNELLQERALRLYHLLSSLSVKYIIDDGTISTNIEARNISYWGTINARDSHQVFNYLEEKGYIKLVKQYVISPQGYAESYSKSYPYNKVQPTSAYSKQTIQLYELLNTSSRIQLLPQVDKVNTAHNILLPSTISKSLSFHYIQSKEYDNQSLIFPFTSVQKSVHIENNQINLAFPTKLLQGSYIFESKNNDKNTSQIINVSIRKDPGVITLYFEYPVSPTIEGAINQSGNIAQALKLNVNREDYAFINIGGTVLPIKNTDYGTNQFIGSVLIHGNSIPISLLYHQDSMDLSNNLVQLESNPQCFNDALENPVSHITGDNGILIISGQNVSNCLTTDASISTQTGSSISGISYARLEFEASGTNEAITQKKNIDSGKPLLYEYVNKLENPLILYVCVKSNISDLCLNKESLFFLTKDNKKFIVPIVGDLTQMNDYHITFAVRSTQRQKYETKITHINFNTFSSQIPQYVAINVPQNTSTEYYVQNNNSLTLSLPVVNSNYQISMMDGALLREDSDCQQNTKYQAIKKNTEGILTYVIGCRDFIQKTVPFSSNNFYLWYVSYKHLSGEIPSIILMDKLNTYMYEKLLPPDVNANNYFSIPFQEPETLLTNKDLFSQVINQTPTYTVSGYVQSEFDLQDNKNKDFIMQYLSYNEGVSQFNDISLIELPNSLQNSVLKPIDYKPERFADQGKILSYNRLLPSLWQVKTDTQQGTYLILFNEQFDSQWIVLNAKATSHARCDGLSNCYAIQLPSGASTFYFFYYPEILNFIGFTITVFSIIGGFFSLL